MTKIKKICPQCGKEFIITKRDKIYCSQNCIQAAYRERQRNNIKQYLLVKKCAYCGKQYHPKKINQRYCCYDCQYKEKLRKQQGKTKKSNDFSSLDKRAAMQKRTGLSEMILQAYQNDHEGLKRVMKYSYENGLSKTHDINEKRRIGHLFRS